MKILWRLFTYIKYQWLSFSSGVILSMLSAALTIYAPQITGHMIDDIAHQYQNKQEIDYVSIIEKLSFYAGIILLSIAVSYVSYNILARASNRVTKEIRDQAHQHMQHLPISYFDNKPAGKVAARIVNDTESLKQNFYMNFMTNIIIHLVTVVGVYIAIYKIHAGIGLGLMGLIPLFIVWQYMYMRLIQPKNLAWRESVSQMNSHIAELIHGISMTQIFQRQDTVLEEFQASNETLTGQLNDIVDIETKLSWEFSEFLKRIVTLLVILFVATHLLNNQLSMSIGTLYLLMDYISRLFDPISIIVRLMSFVQQAIASGSRVFELLDTPVEEDPQAKIVMEKGQVVFDQVNFAYVEGYPILKNITFTAQPGQTIALVGHTGSGKSSIINLLFRFYDPQSGTIQIDGQDIQNYQRESIRNDMGIVLQEPHLFTGTIASNVSMTDDRISDQQVLYALERVGAGPMLAKFDLGIHEPILEKGQSLSSGERQLVSFARALACNPKVLILDEATSHIDTETEAIIQHAMNVVKEGRTTFIIAHRLSTIQHADMILALNEGEIVERGNHAELLSLDGIYAQMYRMQLNQELG